MNEPLKVCGDEDFFSVHTSENLCYGHNDSSDFSIGESKSKFQEDVDVLVRWTDGLLYLANIIQVEDEFGRCAVKFEDGSIHWAQHKDIYKGPVTEGDLVCAICDKSSSQAPDEIVICDKCNCAYHQLCHTPKISTSDLNSELTWYCRKCIFALVAKIGGAYKTGTNANVMMLMKETLPYDLHSLKWDYSHRSNSQQTYCYCGGPGEWFAKMLQCAKCKQWFHEACLQCLEYPLMFGDKFYVFICSVCNKGPEFLKRLPLKWADAIHLTLYNLTIIHSKKFFDIQSSIIPFLKQNWERFQIKDKSMNVESGGRGKMGDVEEALLGYKSKFVKGKVKLKSENIWGLRFRNPPTVPAVLLPESKVKSKRYFPKLPNATKSKNTSNVSLSSKSNHQSTPSTGSYASSRSSEAFSSDSCSSNESSESSSQTYNNEMTKRSRASRTAKLHEHSNGISSTIDRKTVKSPATNGSTSRTNKINKPKHQNGVPKVRGTKTVSEGKLLREKTHKNATEELTVSNERIHKANVKHSEINKESASERTRTRRVAATGRRRRTGLPEDRPRRAASLLSDAKTKKDLLELKKDENCEASPELDKVKKRRKLPSRQAKERKPDSSRKARKRCISTIDISDSASISSFTHSETSDTLSLGIGSFSNDDNKNSKLGSTVRPLRKLSTQWLNATTNDSQASTSDDLDKNCPTIDQLLADGETFVIKGRHVGLDGKEKFLVVWESSFDSDSS